MDPNLFRLDWELLLEVLGTIVFLSFAMERSLALIFEHRLYLKRLDGKGFKEPISFVAAFIVCRTYDIDAMAVVLKSDALTVTGLAITAAMIAGGSKASIKLFHDVFNVKSSAKRAHDELKAVNLQATVTNKMVDSSVRAVETLGELPKELIK